MKKGNFQRTVEKIIENDTNLEMTFSGQEIPPVRMRIIFKALEQNRSITVSFVDPRSWSSIGR